MDAAVSVVVDDIAWLQSGSDSGVPLQKAQRYFTNNLYTKLSLVM